MNTETNNNNYQNNSNTFENNNDEPIQENITEIYNSNEINSEPNQLNTESDINSANNNSNVNTINHQLILAIDVSISAENSEKLEIYKNDDLDDVIDGFCEKHGLDSEKRTYLKAMIEEKLN